MAARPRNRAVTSLVRWYVDRPAEQGSPLDDPPPTYPEFLEDLRICAARVVALSDAADLIFVGRSMESLHYYLDGLTVGARQAPALSLMPLSGAGYISSDAGVYRRTLSQPVFRAHLERFGLSPRALLGRGSARLVDLVSEGGTMRSVVDAIRFWSRASGLDWRRVRRRLGIVAMTMSRQTSPNAFRWWQQGDYWQQALPAGAIATVSMPHRFFEYVGNDQPKRTGRSLILEGSDTQVFSPSEDYLAAGRLALKVVSVATTQEERGAFLRILTKQPQFRSERVRAFAGALR